MDKQVVIQHTSFIKFMIASMIVNNAEVKNFFEDVAFFKYRHMAWAMEDAKMEGRDFDAYFDENEIQKLRELKSQKDLLNYLIADLEENLQSYQDSEKPTIARFKNDDNYFLHRLRKIELEGEITAFNGKKELPGIKLSVENKNALVFFLMEEIFKEYELVLIYTYYKTFSTNAIANSAFTDLVYDSIYHWRRFGELAAQMGVLTLPRVVPVEKYKDEDVIQFLKENIAEEISAEKNCLILAEKIGNEELKEFLLFISRQEVYHAELLQRALNSLS
ncbi:MAG: 4-hydroxythreonine-4-phosphate dehydrogenase [Epsilonproteobacteria bacterium]|jgi:hypothetical protein|nr:4-hydroxythreonine-4-phosphate dehydrogenase [Campylobacterota bacterium]NPA88625.1 4-hydroxythreonine-4-phosphate dehydrogenase [Campylobacterota bacterium]